MEAGRGERQNAKNLDEIWHACVGLVEKVLMSLDREKKSFWDTLAAGSEWRWTTGFGRRWKTVDVGVR